MTNTHKITNKKTDAVLEGMLTYKLARTLFFCIEGTKIGNTFFADEWDIEELPKPVELPTEPVELPTEPGLYRFERGTDIYRLTGDGWVNTYGDNLVGERVIRGCIPIFGPLVRLVPEITEVTDAMMVAYAEAFGGSVALSNDEVRRAAILAAFKAAPRG